MIRAMSQSQTSLPHTCLAACARQHQKQVLGGGSLHRVAGDRDRHCPLEQSVHVKVEGIKTRLNRPLDFEKVRSGRTVEGRFVS